MQRRRFLQLSALAGLASVAGGMPRLSLAAPDLSGVTLNVATYKGAAPTFFPRPASKPRRTRSSTPNSRAAT